MCGKIALTANTVAKVVSTFLLKISFPFNITRAITSQAIIVSVTMLLIMLSLVGN